jgi:hypothetical protein
LESCSDDLDESNSQASPIKGILNVMQNINNKLGVNSSEDEENEVTITNKDPGRN